MTDGADSLVVVAGSLLAESRLKCNALLSGGGTSNVGISSYPVQQPSENLLEGDKCACALELGGYSPDFVKRRYGICLL